MIIKKEFIKREIAGDIVLVPVGTSVFAFNGLFAMNELGSFLWDRIPEAEGEEDLLRAVLQEYEVTEDVARRDIQEFLGELRKLDII